MDLYHTNIKKGQKRSGQYDFLMQKSFDCSQKRSEQTFVHSFIEESVCVWMSQEHKDNVEYVVNQDCRIQTKTIWTWL